MNENSKKFYKKINSILSKIVIEEDKKINKIANIIKKSYLKNGQLYTFGTGHNHILAEEGLHRAGAFAGICPIIDNKTNFSKGIRKASNYERSKNIAKKILDKYNMKSKDVIIIFSNSGINVTPLEAAIYAKKKKIFVIAILSYEYANFSQPSFLGKKLHQIADISIDNKGPVGDALIQTNMNIPVASSSVIAGSFILNMINVKLAKLFKKEEIFPFYLSSNLPNADKHNSILENKFKKRNPFLF